MGNRLSKIYTRTGDDGSTGLADGRRVAKTEPRIEALGAVDEANCALGLVLNTDGLRDELRRCLSRVQHELFELGAELSLPGYCGITPAHVERLEQDLDRYNAELPPLREFILPGGGPAAARCHLARAVCRRAERRLWQLAESEHGASEGVRYLNRLSDLLFVAARLLARDSGHAEVLWQSERVRSDGPAE
jgi:cob(I)alamin adenosyltransferase